MSEVVWNKYSKEEFNDVMKLSDGYIDFLDKTFGKGKMKECEEYLLRLKKLT